MTDRFNALVVVLEHDMREDDAESLVDAIKHLRGVVDVRGNVPSIDAHVAEMRVRSEIRAGSNL